MAGQAAPRGRRMEDVARRAGVSQMTVSRALRTPDKVAPATRAKIAAAVAELDYVPDLVAGGLAARRSRLVAVIVSTLENSIFAATVQGLSTVLREQGYAVLLGASDYSREGEEQLLRAVLGRRPDGIVLTDAVHTQSARRLLRAAGIPVVETWELPAAPLDLAVGFSNLAAGRAMIRGASRLGLPAYRVPRHRGGGRPARAAAAGRLPGGPGRARRRTAARDRFANQDRRRDGRTRRPRRAARCSPGRRRRVLRRGRARRGPPPCLPAPRHRRAPAACRGRLRRLRPRPSRGPRHHHRAGLGTRHRRRGGRETAGADARRAGCGSASATSASRSSAAAAPDPAPALKRRGCSP